MKQEYHTMKRTPWTRIKNARRLLSSSNGICSSFRVGVLFNDPYRCAMTSHSTHLPPACPRNIGVRTSPTKKTLSLARVLGMAGGGGYHPLMGVRTSPIKRPSLWRGSLCAGGRGFEPLSADPESSNTLSIASILSRIPYICRSIR